MPSNRELDATIAELVFGWKWYTTNGVHRFLADPEEIEPGLNIGCVHETHTTMELAHNWLCHVPPYTTDVEADYLVLRHVREKWLDADDYHEANGRWNVFWHSLAEVLRIRDPYYRDTMNQYELYYMQEYRPGDYSRAALAALGVEVDHAE